MKKDFIEYQKGKLPIILSSPHGGYLKPPSVRNRCFGNFNRDVYTQEISRQFQQHLKSITGFYPYLIINLLSRRKLDANRSLKAGTSNKLSKKSWKQYHEFVFDAKKDAIKNYGFCFFVDVHGFPSPTKKFFIGYCLTAKNLKKPDEILNKEKYINKSSIKNIYNLNDFVFSNLVRGKNSFGNIFERNDSSNKYKIIPSPKNKNPNGTFYGGGYNTKIHCVKNNKCTAGFQLEMSKAIRVDKNINDMETGDIEREKFSLVFCQSLVEYINVCYDCKF